jgi:zinc protease
MRAMFELPAARHLVLAALLAWAGCTIERLPDKIMTREFALPQRDFQLASGLRVLVQEDHSTPLVVITSVYAVGATSDPVGREGLAHLVEHLAFRALSPDGKRPAWEVLQRTGATFNASTEADLTSYYAITNKDRLRELMELEAWRLVHPLDGVTEEAFGVEREVVENELRQRSETTVGNRSLDELMARLFPAQHPLGRPIAGSHASLAATTLEDARGFVAQHYRPMDCTMVIAGDVDTDQVAKLLGTWPAQALFGPGGPGGARVFHPFLVQGPASPPPPPVSTALARLEGPVAEPTLLVGWSVPGGLRGNDAMLGLAAAALGLSLRLGLRWELEDKLLSYAVGAEALVEGSVIFVEAHLRTGADPERERVRILDAIGDTPLTNVAVVSVGRRDAAQELLRASTDPVASGLAAARFLATTGQTAYYSRSLEALNRLERFSVRDFADRYLKRGRAASVVFLPEQGPAAMAASRPGADGGHELHREADVNLTAFGPAEIAHIAHPPGLAALPRFRLASGLEVVLARRPGSLLAQMVLRLPGGDATTSPFGLASLAANLSHPCGDTYEALQVVGGSLSEQHDAQASVVTARAMSGNLENVLAGVARAVSCRFVPDGPFVAMDEQMRRDVERQREAAKRPQMQAHQALWTALYPGHPYGRTTVDAEALTSVSRSAAEAYVEAHFRPDHAIAVVTGDVSEATVRPLMQKHYAAWTGPASGFLPPPTPAPGALRSIQVFDRPGATQSSVTLGCRVDPVAAETLPAFDVLAAVLEEEAWQIRAQWGATYGFSARVRDYPGGAAHLLVEGDVETSRTGVAVEHLLGLVVAGATVGPSIKTFTLKRWDLARKFDQTFATPTAVAQAILRARANGWPDDVWDRYPERLAALSRAGVRQALAPCAGHEVVTVVGDAATVRTQLAARGLTVASP